MGKKIAYLDRNEYNYGPAPEIEKVLRNFDPDKLCFYTRIYDEGKKKYSIRLHCRIIRYSRETSHFRIWRGRHIKTGCSLFPIRRAETKKRY